MQNRPAPAPANSGTSGTPVPREGFRRAIGAMVALGALSPLAVAARLTPSPTGVGTHVQLGLFQCGWMIAFGKPCPTCGMTTAFAEAAHAHLITAFLVQPMGAFLALMASAAVWAGLHVALTGSDLGRVCGNLLHPRVLWLLAAAAGAAWAYKLVVWRQP